MTLRVPLADLSPDPKQPRRYFRKEALVALLLDSIDRAMAGTRRR